MENKSELVPIEELMKRSKTAATVHAGTCTMQGWLPGRRMTMAEYRTAVNKFMKAR